MFNKLMLKATLLTIQTASICQVHGILHFNWPKAALVDSSELYHTVECFTELTRDHLDKPIFVNSSSLRLKRPCMIRIPTQTEIIFSVGSVSRKSTLRVISGSSKTTQKLTTPQLIQRKKPSTEVTNPVYVGCTHGTIVFKPYDINDHLVFLIKEARPELINSEDTSRCDNDLTSDETSLLRAKRSVGKQV